MVAAALTAPVAQASNTAPQQHLIQDRQRLSAWLAASGVVRPTGRLQWWSAAHRDEQAAWQAALVRELGPSWSPLASTVRQMPITGRVPLPSLDARLLEARPAQDPWLLPGDRLVSWAGPAVVAVLLPSGYVCRVPHDERARVMSYLQACGVEGALQAWVTQADGRVLRVGLRPDLRDDLAQRLTPGAWVWAPPEAQSPGDEVSARLATFLGTQLPASADEPWSLARQLNPDTAWQPPLRPMPALSNDWGGVGLLQMPTARMAPVGSAALTLSSVWPYTELKARLQPFERVSVSFGYLSISGRRYGPDELAGDQSYKDKTADLKLRLWQEGSWWPEVAVGWRDILGTGLFASEYLVATKAWGNLDLTAGLAFGYLGSRGQVANPLGVVSDRFKQRQRADVGKGGTLDARTFFTGRASFFGGVQWAMPAEGWWLKAEIDPIDYRDENTGGRSVAQSSPVNLAVVHRPWPWLDVSLGVERGQRVALSLSAQVPLPQLNTPKRLDPPFPSVVAQAPGSAQPWPDLAEAVEQQTGGRVSLVQRRGERLSLRLHDPVGHAPAGALERTLAVVHAQQPATVQTVEVQVVREGVPVVSAQVDRARWVQSRTEWAPGVDWLNQAATAATDTAAAGLTETSAFGGSTPQPLPGLTLQAVSHRPAGDPAAAHQADQLAETDQRQDDWQAPDESAFKHGVGLFYRQNLGGPDGFWLYQLGLDWSAQWRLRPDTWLAGTGRLRVLDNYDQFKYTAPSDLPRVRTFIREYLTTRRFTVPHLQLTHARALSDDWFAMVYGGLLETMFAGVGGEVLWRPVGSRLAVGVDVNAVQQRAFTQGLSLRDYRVTTGHLTAYWDTGWQDLLVKASAGRYLAGDVGVTLDVSRVFANGLSMGAYATKTDVPAEQFGEGSFDKGVYVSIPFDVMLPRSSSSTATVTYAPLIRDGGARLDRRYTLHELTRARDARQWQLLPKD